jgi:DNA-3-methyladenine glycosylase I
MTRSTDVVVGDDGRARCAWSAGSEEYRDYHDRDWGTVVHDDRHIFERLTLEAFQSGLAWITILRKRDGFRAAFADFDFGVVADFKDRDVERLMTDASIVRNRAKILATITNARASRDLVAAEGVGSLDALVWSHAPAKQRRPKKLSDIAPVTDESRALAKTLKARGFAFVGPTTAYATMQALGMVDDHVAGCWRAN